MKIVHVLDVLRPSGVERMLQVSADEWTGRGHQIEVLATGSNIGPFARDLARCGVVVSHIPFSRSPGFLLRLARFLATSAPDVIHLHMERAFLWIALVARARGVRVVFAPCSLVDIGGWWRIRRVIQRRIARSIGVTMIAISPSVQANEKSRFKNRTELLWNWIDTVHFRAPTANERAQARTQLGLQHRARVVACVGSCTPLKRHEMLIEAFAAVAENGTILLHVGDGPGQENEKSLAGRLVADGDVRFLGAVSDPRPAYWAADVFAMTSAREGLGNAALEAAATGLPLVLTDVPGLRDIARLYEGCWLVRTEISHIARRLHDLTSSRAPLAASAKGHPGGSEARLREAVSVPAGVDRYVAIYERSTVRGRTSPSGISDGEL